MSVTRPTQKTSSLSQFGLAGAQAGRSKAEMRNAAKRACSFFIEMKRTTVCESLYENKYTFTSTIRQADPANHELPVSIIPLKLPRLAVHQASAPGLSA